MFQNKPHISVIFICSLFNNDDRTLDYVAPNYRMCNKTLTRRKLIRQNPTFREKNLESPSSAHKIFQPKKIRRFVCPIASQPRTTYSSPYKPQSTQNIILSRTILSVTITLITFRNKTKPIQPITEKMLSTHNINVCSICILGYNQIRSSINSLLRERWQTDQSFHTTSGPHQNSDHTPATKGNRTLNCWLYGMLRFQVPRFQRHLPTSKFQLNVLGASPYYQSS